MSMKLFDYLHKNNISFSNDGSHVYLIGGKTFFYHESEDGVFDDKFNVCLADIGYDYYIIQFGGRFYYVKPSATDIELNELKYVGENSFNRETKAFLGVHGMMEIMSGSRDYPDWVKKAKWLGVEYLGLCEHETVAGAMKFAKACKSEGIKPIIGASFDVSTKSGDARIKFYAKDSSGWDYILMANTMKNVDGSLTLDDILSADSSGVIFVVDAKTTKYDCVFPLFVNSDDVYFQFDFSEMEDRSEYVRMLENISEYFDRGAKPCSIIDAYYLDSDDACAVGVIESIGGKYRKKFTDQSFKSKDKYLSEMVGLFETESEALDVFDESVKNELEIAKSCKFEFEFGHRHLPKYELTKEEVELYGNSENMFVELIKQGLDRLYPNYTDEHIARISREVEVLEMGNVIDYFLITRDIINAANKEGILSGVGRGSAGGSVVSYLLGIIKIDPLSFGLIFERFLNEGRVKSSLPDIDSDFEGAGGEWVKEYMCKRFGESQVCSVGTYTTLQLKGAIKDVFRAFHNGGDYFSEVNIATSCIDGSPVGDSTLADLFRRACTEKKLYEFILKYPYVFYYLPYVLNAPKAQSVHACAMIIFPKDKHMGAWTPIYKNKSGVVVTAFEGGELDDSGFLKQDILKVKQLDKFKSILKRIEMNGKEVPDIYNLPLDDKNVYRYFSNGWNGDVFQFKTSGLTSYTRSLKPNNINDLIASVALYRPGTMDNGFHESYIRRKNGEEEVDYYWGTEDILKDTYGLVVYQEQVMRLCTDLAGFSLVVADDIRKAMGKKKLDVLLPYKDAFVDGATKNGCPHEVADKLWNIMIEFSKYAFNLSHSAAYAVTGYISQYLKVYYPLEYWATALSYASDDELPIYLSEISESGSFGLEGVDINGSNLSISDTQKGIYWSFGSVNGIGGVSKANPEGGTAVRTILNERSINGDYKSFDDFIERCGKKGGGVNKKVVEALVFSGAFDRLCGVKRPSDRANILLGFYDRYKVKVDQNKSWIHKNHEIINEDWVWILKQKSISGLAFFDFEGLCLSYLSSNKRFISSEDMALPLSKTLNGTFGGVIIESVVRKTSKGDEYAKLTVESNYSIYTLMVWGDEYSKVKANYEDIVGKIILAECEAKFDSKYSQSNQLTMLRDGEFVILG